MGEPEQSSSQLGFSEPYRREDQVQFPSLPEKPQGENVLAHTRMRSRGKSISEHTHDAAAFVAPPVSIPTVMLCLLWYICSAVSSNLSKGILVVFPYPVSLTLIQFIYAISLGLLCTICASKSRLFASLFPKGTVSTDGIEKPSRFVASSTGPMAAFQVVGHIFSHSATSQISVALVHAIKSLSPLFTILAYSVLFRVRYNIGAYISLVPLTSGVVMACAGEFRAKPVALLYALSSCLVFVAQNIYSKGLLTQGRPNMESAGSQVRKLDKLTILYWCAGIAFVCTLPIWLVTDGLELLRNGVHLQGSKWLLFKLCTLNGLSHFLQNLLSFMILGSISTVAFSIASLLKRIVVISAAVIWYGQSLDSIQKWGIVITFVGLYIYDRFGSRTPDKAVLPK